VSTLASVLVLLLAIGLLSVRRADAAAGVCVGQGICAAVALATTGSMAALIVLAFNGLLAPLASWRILGHTKALRVDPLQWLLAVALLIVSLAGFSRLGDNVALGAAVVLLGLLMSGRGAPAIGLLSAQNGLVLVASAVPDMPLLLALTIAVPLVPAMLIAEAWLRR